MRSVVSTQAWETFPIDELMSYSPCESVLLVSWRCPSSLAGGGAAHVRFLLPFAWPHFSGTAQSYEYLLITLLGTDLPVLKK